ncbi:unnamed protein product [Rodentolepis nana]|uniref:G_PROTEIN_RECEP_F1_2 domain-containing protein n=1 Tax=Rodentolepis nana TaxID=102285 RepID=A0A0R3TZA0_RODNA|nr:unnamed protein product [Rodentolepis nana]
MNCTWEGIVSQQDWNVLDFTMIAIEWIGMIPNILAFFLLCQLDGKTRTSLLMLRTVVICAFLKLLINFIDDICPPSIETGIYGLDFFICGVWESRFVYWIFSIVGAHALIYFAAYRTMQIAEHLQFSFATSANIDLIYVAGLTIYSVMITFPQIVSVQFYGVGCQCGKKLNSDWGSELVYAQVYIFFSQVFIINSMILAICSMNIIKWIKNTPKESFYDTLNILHFKDDTLKMTQAYEKECGWSTSSMCIVPMTFTYTIAFSFDTTYQFVSAIGLTSHKQNDICHKIAQALLLIHPAAIPFVIFYYIPALRFRALRHWNQILVSIGQCRNIRS